MIPDLFGQDFSELPPKLLFVELLEDRGGRPLSSFEVGEITNNFNETARIVIAIYRLREQALSGNSYAWNRFEKIVKRTSQRDIRRFTDDELDWIVRITRVPRKLRNDGTLELSIGFVGAVYTNPTRFEWVITGMTATLLLGAIVWAGVNINHQVGAGACLARAQEFANDSRKMLEAQARREGHGSAEMAHNNDIISQSLLAATENCTRIIGLPRLKISTKPFAIEAELK